MKFTYLVEVEVDRDEGKFVGRDEISDIIAEGVESAAESAELSGLGIDASSSYSVTNVSVDELDNKTLKEAYKAYDAHVARDTPGDPELRKKIKSLHSQLKNLNRVLDSVKEQNRSLLEEQEQGATRIFQKSYFDEKTTYISEDEPITFRYSDDDEFRGSFAVGFSVDGNDGRLEIRTNGWADLLVQPQSGNVILVKAVHR